jgi:hypothetical protein
MALTLGSVSVSASGVVTKSGECGTLYDAMYADAVALAAEAGVTIPSGPDGAAMKKGVAKMATTMATYCHGLLTARAKVQIAPSASGLQRMSNPLAINVNTQGPTAEKLLPII